MRVYRLNPVGDAKHARDAECPAAAWKPLSRKQKTMLVLLAKRGWLMAGEPETFDAWRHGEALAACGRRISEATQEHWAALRAAYQQAVGDDAGAFRTHLRDGDNKRRIAAHKLTQALAAAGLERGYAERICRAQFKCAVADASAKQLWCLFYTVRNRRKGGAA